MTRRVNLAAIKSSFKLAFLAKFLTVGCVLLLIASLLFNIMQLTKFEFVAAAPLNTSPQKTLGKHIRKSKKTTKKVRKGPVSSLGSATNLNCLTNIKANSNLASSTVSQLRKLYDYETACGGKIADRLMIFEATPATTSEAKTMAADVALQLKEFNRFSILPLVIFEPTTSNGLVNFQSYAGGSYDKVLDTYFKTLTAQGISNEMMGMWVSFPEANIPVWQTTNPDLFARCVTKTVQYQKKYFPASQASILLQSMSYPNGWGSGSYSSLSPYVKNLPKGLLDSFGYQGFAWPDTYPDYAASHFLNPSLAIAAAKQLNVKSVWFNTGTFSKGKADNGQIIKLSPVQRQNILNYIVKQAKTVKGNGFNVSVNLFAENKYNTSEAIDWSYWPAGRAETSIYKPVFINFVHELRATGLKLWLFDADD